MKRQMLILVGAVMLVTSCAPMYAGSSSTYFGFQLGISNAPPPPSIVYRERPGLMLVPGTRVYVVEEDPYGLDVFSYGSFWYVYSTEGYWYRASSYQGPFVVIDVRSVPRQVISVPERYWKRHPHGGPPGQMKKGRDGRW